MLRGVLRSSSLLARLRVPVAAAPSLVHGNAAASAAAGAGGSLYGLARPMSDAAAAHGSYLNKDEVLERVLAIMKAFPKVDPSKVTPTSHFQNDLGMDSLDVVEVVMGLEQEFALEIPDAEADKMLSVPAAVEYIAGHPMSK